MNHFTHYNRWSENYDVNEWLRSYNHTPGLYSGYDNPPIGYVNGVGTDLTAALQTGYELGYLLDTNVIVTHVPSFTVGADLLKCTMGRMGIATEAVHKIHENWTNYFTNYPDKDLFWVCHSGGAIDTRNALASYPNELCQRINVLAIAPGGFMDDHLCKSIVHIVSSMDPVPKTDPIGWARCRDNIVVLRGNGITDHYILNNMYAQDIKEYYNEFKKRSQS